jgi:hypothetical protein
MVDKQREEWKRSNIEKAKRPFTDGTDQAPGHDHPHMSVLDTDHIAKAKAHKAYADANNMGSGSSEEKIRQRHMEHTAANIDGQSRMPPQNVDRPDLDRHKHSDSGRAHKSPSKLESTADMEPRDDKVKYR